MERKSFQEDCHNDLSVKAGLTFGTGQTPFRLITKLQRQIFVIIAIKPSLQLYPRTVTVQGSRRCQYLF